MMIFVLHFLFLHIDILIRKLNMLWKKEKKLLKWLLMTKKSRGTKNCLLFRSITREGRKLFQNAISIKFLCVLCRTRGSRREVGLIFLLQHSHKRSQLNWREDEGEIPQLNQQHHHHISQSRIYKVVEFAG